MRRRTLLGFVALSEGTGPESDQRARARQRLVPLSLRFALAICGTDRHDGDESTVSKTQKKNRDFSAHERFHICHPHDCLRYQREFCFPSPLSFLASRAYQPLSREQHARSRTDEKGKSGDGCWSERLHLHDPSLTHALSSLLHIQLLQNGSSSDCRSMFRSESSVLDASL